MPGLVPGIHVLLSCEAKTWMAGHRRAEATPSFGRLCPAMTGLVSTRAGSIPLACIDLIERDDDLERDQDHHDDLQPQRALGVDDVGKRGRGVGNHRELAVLGFYTLAAFDLIITA